MSSHCQFDAGDLCFLLGLVAERLHVSVWTCGGSEGVRLFPGGSVVSGVLGVQAIRYRTWIMDAHTYLGSFSCTL